MSTSALYNYLAIDATLSAVGVGSADVTTLELPDTFTQYSNIEVQLNSAAPTGTVTTPTCDAKVQMSFDKTNWFDILTFTQTTTSAAVERKEMIATASVAVGRYMRLYASVATASGTATYGLTFYINAR